MWPNPQFPAVLVTFDREILNWKFHFLCKVKYCFFQMEKKLSLIKKNNYFKKMIKIDSQWMHLFTVWVCVFATFTLNPWVCSAYNYLFHCNFHCLNVYRFFEHSITILFGMPSFFSILFFSFDFDIPFW